MVTMNRNQILQIIKEEKPFLKQQFGLRSIGIFGSYAKDLEQPASDIDLLVEFSEPRFDFIAGLQIYLENRLGRPVEIIRKRKNISKRFLARIEKDIHYA